MTMLLVPFLLVALEFVWQAAIKYPPTLDQINIGIGSPIMLWGLRILSLVFILTASFFFSQRLKLNTKKYFWIILLASPTISLLWMAYPGDVLKIFLILLVFFLLTKLGKSFWLVAAACGATILLLNLAIFNQKPVVAEILSTKVSQTEVINRIMVEDHLNPHINLPTWFRRIGYNKYFVTVKNLANESLKFFDFETLFFQEVHPMGQKAFVMFFWPEVFLALISFWFLMKEKVRGAKEISLLFVLSFIYFLTTNTSMERRLALSLFPLTAVLAEGISLALGSRFKMLKVGTIFLILLSFYGYLTNYHDRFVRPDFWLDNRPLAYQFVFKNLEKLDLTKYRRILIPDTLFAAQNYCKYYLKNCPTLEFRNFDMTKESPNSETLYVGFVGNFLSPNPENNFPSEYSGDLVKERLEIIDKTRIHDNIANGYGQDLLVVKTK